MVSSSSSLFCITHCRKSSRLKKCILSARKSNECVLRHNPLNRICRISVIAQKACSLSHAPNMLRGNMLALAGVLTVVCAYVEVMMLRLNRAVCD
ncbi:hypothetical protein EVAR_44907_1 [Eumeta japonica]|uniref:Uncharacterized protein n=1 Tax=Eumeta variegata TaxID=151549 RepID=A0A4C1XIT0_EUMVA|nr:hypothetical protein EVAR_44907_1 [Eumeta japonica]